MHACFAILWTEILDHLTSMEIKAFISPFICFPTLPWSLLNSTPVNEQVFNRILRRECKAVGPGGPDLISLWLFQALVSHFNSGKRNLKKKLHDSCMIPIHDSCMIPVFSVIPIVINHYIGTN